MNTTWKWSEDGNQLLDCTDGHTVLKIRPSPATQQEFDLIVAAPELLHELEEILSFTCVERAMLRKQELDSIRRIIAKAKGQ